MNEIRLALPPTTKILFGRKGDLMIVALLFCNVALVFFCFGTFSYYIENALFETSQNIYLFGASVLYFVAARRADDPASKIFWLALSVFCMSVRFREMDPRGTDLEY